MSQGSTPSALEVESLVCPACGYDLRGIGSDKCPECGQAIDRSEISVCRIPWEHRGEIGRVRAFWRTTRMVMFHPRKFAEEMNRPLTYGSARGFQMITVTLVWIVSASWISYAGSLEFHPKFEGPGAVGWVLETGIFVAAVLSVWPMLLMITRAAGYWFHPGQMSVERQNRAVALSCYACASLAWLWLPSVMVVMYALIQSLDPRGFLEQMSLVLTILAELVVLFILIDWYVVTVYLMKATTHAGGGRTFAMAVTLPLLWLLCVVVAAAVPALLAFASLIVLSFR